MKPIRDRQILPRRWHVTVCYVLKSKGSLFFSDSSLCLPRWPFVWFQRKWWPGRRCVASSSDYLLVLSTDGNRCYKWGKTFSTCLPIFSEVSLCHDGQWTILHRVRSLVGDGLPSWRHVLHRETVFSGAWPRCW